jgi:hypothetical protein
VQLGASSRVAGTRGSGTIPTSQDCLDAGAVQQWVQQSLADVSARLARLKISSEVSDGDWGTIAAVAASKQYAAQLADRFNSRLKWLPYCHHLRFPLYEQVRCISLISCRAGVLASVILQATRQALKYVDTLLMKFSAFCHRASSHAAASAARFLSVRLLIWRLPFPVGSFYSMSFPKAK